MARISMLLSLALVLAIASVSAHPPSHKKTQKTLCPPTLSELQTFPYTELSKLIEKKSQSASNTVQFNALFSIVKAYNDFLGAFKISFAKNALASVHIKYALMTKAMLAAQAFVGVNEGVLAVELKNSYTLMAEGYVNLVEKIAEISIKYKFDGNAKISEIERKEIDRCVIQLKGAIKVFVKVITQCSKKFSAVIKTGFKDGHAGLTGKLIGLGGEGKVEAGSKLGAKVGAKFGAKIGGKIGGGAKVGGKAGGFLLGSH